MYIYIFTIFHVIICKKNSQEVPNFSQRGNMCFLHSKKHEGTTSPRKFNIAPENRQSQKESHLPTIICEGRAVKFQGRDNIVTKVTITKSDGLNLIHRSFGSGQVIPFVISPFLFVSYNVATFHSFKCPLMCLFCFFWGVGWLDVCIFKQNMFFLKKTRGSNNLGV